MKQVTRRQVLKTGVAGAAGLAISPAMKMFGAVPLIKGDLTFRPYLHPLMDPIESVYLADENGDPFESPVRATDAGIVVPDGIGESFSVNTKFFIEGFGNVWLEANNGGEMYTADDFSNDRILNLNHEFARSLVEQNRKILDRYRSESNTEFSTETIHLQELAQELVRMSSRSNGETMAELSDKSLLYGLWASEKIELDQARWTIERQARSDTFYFGCETRQYIWAKSVAMVDRFVELFNYATLTHYVYDTWYPVFEPREGEHQFGIKDEIVDWLTEHEITIEGRPLLWFHPWVMPDWLREKNYDELKTYVERHVREVVGHYGDKVEHWEVVNEYHDWANEFRHTPDQINEITRLACETTHEVNPDVVRIINNCCSFGEYAASGYDSAGEMDRPLRTPRKFVEELIEAEVPFEVTGVQMYFPERTLADIVRLLERFAALGKPVYITEIGATSGPTREEIFNETMSIPEAPYDWHRPWDEDLQADWLEQLYTILYSKPYIENLSWYDFADFRTFIPNGGLIRMDGERKQSFHRLEGLLEDWDRLPAMPDRDVTGGPR